MEPFITCLGFVVLVAMLVPFILAFAHARKIKALETAVEKLGARIASLESGTREPVAPVKEEPVVRPTPEPPVTAAAPAVPPPLPTIPRAAAPTPTVVVAPPKPATKPRAAIDWESFLGVKLFAWIGGFVLFLGVVFLVKYAFENNVITPAMRVIGGAIIGCALVAIGWFAARRNYRVPGQSLCATGVVILYADIFGAHAFYGLVSLGTAFVLMCVVTVAAFFLAVRLNAQVVVILGLLGGFLTPALLNEHTDQPLRLFSYIALLDAGIAAVVLRKRWNYLLVLAAAGTALMQLAWASEFGPAKATAGMLIFLGFEGQFLLFAWLRQKIQPPEKWSMAAACITGASALAFGFLLLDFRSLATRPGYFFGYTFLADIGLLALALSRKHPARIAAPAGSIVFLLLASWTALFLRHDLLWWALGAYVLFALIHAGFSVWPAREETKTKTAAPIWQSYVPLLALALLFIAVSRGETSFALWAVVLLIDIIAVGVAVTSKSVVALLAALVATLFTAGLWVVTAPPLNESVIGILTVIGTFGVFFSSASSFFTRKLGLTSGDSRRHVPALSAAMPFVLLLMVIAKLPIGVPTPVFAVALLLAVLLLALGILSRTSWVAAVALVFTWAVECEWHTMHLTDSYAFIALGWYVVFLLLFVAYPFFSAEKDSWLPWAIGALSGLLHFGLIFDLKSIYPQMQNGLVPAAFIIPFAFGVWFLIKKRGVIPASGDARLAWQGGAALLFLSLIFPIQFDREWITLGWAVEGLSLLALFRTVPNKGLRVVGTGMLSLAFVRLALNPAIFEYHRRTPVRIWNWYLYAYGLTSLCLFGGAHLLRNYRETLFARVAPRYLYTLGTILTFLLLNIEIADFFSIGPTLVFSFSGNFARDMSYSIAWALFAFVLLLVGMKKNMRFVRYAGLALLLVTLVKLFLHDLGYLSQLYRIGAFIGVALILIVASFVYQRFLAPRTKAPPAP